MSVRVITRRSWVQQIMGMPISIHLRGSGTATARQAAVDAAFSYLRDVDRIFSTYRADSDISRLRRGETMVAECDPSVAEVLVLCEEARAATNGYFDAHLPGPDGVRRLDPSGLVKGWAVQRATDLLTTIEGDDHYVNAGGDIVLHTANSDGATYGSSNAYAPGWRIGVEDPFHPTTLLGAVTLHSGGVATSGTTHRGAHVIDPISGRPAVALRSVTVVGPSLLWADVYATAALARGDVSCFEWPAGYDAVAVGADRQRSFTAGMRARLWSPTQTGSEA